MLITRISGCKGKTFLLNRKDLDEIKYNFYKKVNGHSVNRCLLYTSPSPRD
mgnify:CR=1 FL=1